MTEWWKRNKILLPPLFFMTYPHFLQRPSTLLRLSPPNGTDITYPSYNACQLYDVCHHPTTLFPNDSMASIYTMTPIVNTASQKSTIPSVAPSQQQNVQAAQQNDLWPSQNGLTDPPKIPQMLNLTFVNGGGRKPHFFSLPSQRKQRIRAHGTATNLLAVIHPAIPLFPM